MPDARANFAYSTVLTAPATPTAGTSLVVQSGDGAIFPAAPFNAVVCPAGLAPRSGNAEVIRVTAKAADTFTITRNQESSTNRSILVGDQIFAAITAHSFADYLAISNNLLDVANVATARANLAIGQAARAYRNAALAITGTGGQSMLADTIDFDPGSNMGGSPVKYTVPRTGYYLVLVTVEITTSASSFFNAQIWKNGVADALGVQHQTTGGASSWRADAAAIVNCNVNDTLEGALSVGAVSTTSLGVGRTRCHYSVIQLA